MIFAIRRRAAATAATVALTASGLAAAAPAAQAEDRQRGASDTHVVQVHGELSRAQIAAADITGSSRARDAVARGQADGMAASGRNYRVYDFAGNTYVLAVADHFRVLVGRNAAGEQVQEVVPTALPREVSAQPGYVIPPSSAFRYNNDSSYTQSVGTWYRTIWWTINKANDYKACSTCTAKDYWRILGKMRASSVTGSSAYEGFKRAWLEFDRKDGWSTTYSFEADKPEDSTPGQANVTTTYGFGTNFSVNLGVPPITASGGVDTSYGGSLTKSSENFHPVIRTEIASGGSQWCRYESAEFTGTKTITTRTSGQISSTGTMNGWSIYTGQQETTGNCPTQI